MIKGFHKEGKTILIASSLAAATIFTITYLYAPVWLLALVSLTLFVFLILFFQFFRVPKRSVTTDIDGVVCPADGKVVVIEEVHEGEFLDQACRQISIFMSPLNVHINWFPISGKVLYSKYHPGKFLVAVAGAVARRIVNYAKIGTQVNQSQEFGFIKFGSRIDVFLPLDAEINVKIGEKVVGSKTIIAKLK